MDDRAKRGEAVGFFPLCGLPVPIKDNIDVEGYNTVGGTAILEGGYLKPQGMHAATHEMQETLLRACFLIWLQGSHFAVLAVIIVQIPVVNTQIPCRDCLVGSDIDMHDSAHV